MTVNFLLPSYKRFTHKAVDKQKGCTVTEVGKANQTNVTENVRMNKKKKN